VESLAEKLHQKIKILEKEKKVTIMASGKKAKNAMRCQR